jgi:D-alanyl-lipoteichoic acid acyltransferase DltB (MBOAT superfamily)
MVVTLAAFWAVHRNRTARVLVLIAASYVFYASANPWFLILLLYVSLLDFWLGGRIARATNPRTRKWLTAASIVSSLSLLVFFKYTNFFLNAPADAAALFGVDWRRFNLPIPQPLGISFFVFQTISYIVDVYRRKIEPCEKPLDYLLYIAFFPRMVVGPIVRAGRFLPQLDAAPRLTKERFGLALFFLICGFVKKLIFAEFVRLNLVDKVLDLPTMYSATEALAAVYGSVLQLYCDFSGYMDIVIGIALLFGLQLPDNFHFPFKARNNRAFWRGWHITLSTWLQDYLYIPLGGSRVSHSWKLYRNLMITMVLAGLWHGAAWTYVLMGVSFGLGLVVTRLFQGKKGPLDYLPGESKFLYFVDVFTTFQFLAFTWVFYKARDVSNLVDVLSRLTPFLAGAPNFLIVKFGWALAHGEDLRQTVMDHALFLKKALLGVTNLPLAVVGVMALGACGMWLPEKWYEKSKAVFVRLPWPVQLLIAALAMLAIYKATSFQVTPFEYQRF